MQGRVGGNYRDGHYPQEKNIACRVNLLAITILSKGGLRQAFAAVCAKSCVLVFCETPAAHLPHFSALLSEGLQRRFTPPWSVDPLDSPPHNPFSLHRGPRNVYILPVWRASPSPTPSTPRYAFSESHSVASGKAGPNVAMVGRGTHHLPHAFFYELIFRHSSRRTALEKRLAHAFPEEGWLSEVLLSLKTKVKCHNLRFEDESK